jgi:hypothetical protein
MYEGAEMGTLTSEADDRGSVSGRMGNPSAFLPASASIRSALGRSGGGVTVEALFKLVRGFMVTLGTAWRG